MNRTEAREKIRQDFLDIGSFPTFSFEDESIDRALDFAIEELSRLVPDHRVAEIHATLDAQSTIYSKTATTTIYTQVSLGSPVKLGSIVITSGATTFTRDTDYVIDHFNGIITFPTGSAIFALSNPTNITIAWEKSRSSFSMNFLTNLRAIDSVQVYQGSILDNHDYPIVIQGSIISLTNDWELGDNNYLLVNYSGRYTLPDDNNDGTLPEFLAELVIKGAEANLLFARAISLEITQSANYNNLSSLDDEFTTVLTDLASGRTNLAAAVAQLVNSVNYITSVLTEVNNELIITGTERTAVDAALTAALAEVTLAKGFVDTEVATAITDAIAKLTAADTDLNNALTVDLPAAIGFIDTEVPASVAVAEADIETTAQGYLDLGDDKLDDVNVGADPAMGYAKYAEVQTAMANTVIEGAKTRFGMAEAYVNNAKVRVDSANNRYQQAVALIDTAAKRLNLAENYQTNANINLEVAKTRLAKLQNYLDKMTLFFNNAVNLYLVQAKTYIEVVAGYQNSVQLQIAVINAGVSRQAEVRASGEFMVTIAERLRNEATRRLVDFQTQVNSRAQTMIVRSTVPRQQS